MQVQAIADRMAGLPVEYRARQFQEPWAALWRALEKAEKGTEKDVLLELLMVSQERDQLINEILMAQPGFRMRFPSLAEIAEELAPIEFLWPGWIPRSMITLLGASPGSGKSMLALDLAWRIISGRGFPDGSPVPEPGAPVIYVEAENVPQILNERAENYQIDRKKLYLMMPDDGDWIDFGSEKYRNRLIELAAAVSPELIIIDSLSSVHSKGQNNVEDVRELLSYLSQLAGAFRAGMLLVHHIRKPGSGQQSMMNFDLDMSDLSGSGHIVAMSRVVMGLHVVQTGPEFDPNGPRELKMLKTNLGPYEKSLGFEFRQLQPKGVYLHWLDEAPQRFQEPTKEEECQEWLLMTMLEAGKPVKPSDIVELGKDFGYSRSIIYRAREALASRIKNSEGRRSPQNEWELIELSE
jgi:KaiC/GvpD/RAD55 family RecA-like ATPase